ncbi:putative mRNA-splicing protein ubp10 [Neolecta irregularis DAH-3]|uniref:Putative mRNA-splicing protein ubp10 n=1 Tax=Neolecta irregularis (strain DAH-3) TaxID=1198029 RepID=A0A1U7LM98_NEOID|nr:putative mRNA-splicing protein ubp10 [Neolecta irregularis DAH-3]|eukprot:OLL23785.1 putative mRNA-splicing protein ubp10 [Neolecta irregularis DAH-3]
MSKRPTKSSSDQISDPSTPSKRQKFETNGVDEVQAEDNVLEFSPEKEIVPPNDNLYLDTIDRTMLDFDFEKLCSVSLSNLNVYACLVCGKYYQGRGQSSHAYFHSLHEDHHVYINLASLKVYILPDGYEVKSATLSDIKYVVNPTYSKEKVSRLDKQPIVAYDLTNKKYLPGFVGLNNIKQNDYLNVVIQALTRVTPLRNFCMLEDLSSRSELVQRFAVLIRKLWNPKSFKAHVSPHELLQEISATSNKKFKLTEQSDPLDFLAWFLNKIHIDLGGSRTKPGTSIIHKVFQGKVRMQTQTVKVLNEGDRARFEGRQVTEQIIPFLFLTLELPPPPLFQDEMEKNIIPQVALSTILQKYDGVTIQELSGQRKRFKISQLSPFLILHIKRFTKNNFFAEKNPTIVNFPIKNLDMGPYAEGTPENQSTLYDLVANITHESVTTPTGGEKHVFRVQVRDKSRDEWMQIQDLYVEEIRKEMIFLGESYVQIWERQKL